MRWDNISILLAEVLGLVPESHNNALPIWQMPDCTCANTVDHRAESRYGAWDDKAVRDLLFNADRHSICPTDANGSQTRRLSCLKGVLNLKQATLWVEDCDMSIKSGSCAHFIMPPNAPEYRIQKMAGF
jgi:hypothetical protein